MTEGPLYEPLHEHNFECNVRSACYSIALTTAICRRCGAEVTLAALAVPPDHEVLNDDVNPAELPPDAPDGWDLAAAGAFLFYINQISNRVSARIGSLCAGFTYGFFDETSSQYWGNACTRCGSKFEDHDEHCEPGGAFCPATPEDAARITLIPVIEPLQALADGYTPHPPFFDSMRHGRARAP